MRAEKSVLGFAFRRPFLVHARASIRARHLARVGGAARVAKACTLSAVTVRWTVVGLLALELAAGCGSSSSRVPEACPVEQDLLSGTRAIQNTHDRRQLDSAVRRVLVRLRRDRASTARERRVKALAIQGSG